MRALITGSTGQLGSYVVEAFRDAGHETVGVDVRPSAFTDIVGDVRRKSDVAASIVGCDVVVHLAAQVSAPASITDAMNDADHNIMGTLAVLEAAHDAGVGRVVYASSAAVYGVPEKLPISESHPTRPLVPYGLSKLTGERYVLMFHALRGLPGVAVRPFNIYSHRQDPTNPYSGVLSRFADRVRGKDTPIIEGDGLQTRDFVHASDVARAILLVAEHADAPGRVFNVGTGVASTILDAARALMDGAAVRGGPRHVAPRVGDIRESVADIAALAELGWEPRIPFADGVKELLSA